MTSPTPTSLASLLVIASACGDNAAGPLDAAFTVADDGTSGQGLPDLFVNRGRLASDLAIGEREFVATDCELDPDEACVAAPGLRRLLYFSIETPNRGEGDLVLGQPSESGAFQFSQCHGHYHFLGYAAYQLRDASGSAIAVGRKQAFCLVDTSIYDEGDATVSRSPRYSCGFQGLQRGWADVYSSELPCQFLDITDLADGDYQLVVAINGDRRAAESDYDNNVATLPLTIGASALATPTEPCPVVASRRDIESQNRECGWRFDAELACTPGASVRVGCNQDCGAFSLGSCTGDPMLRVCDAARPDGNCSFAARLAADDNSCASKCPIASPITCPGSGRLAVFSAARSPGSAYTCEPSVQEMP